MRRVYITRGGAYRARRAAGFTLVEVLAVLLIIGVMLAVVLRSPVSSNANLVAQSGQLGSHLRFAQSLAMANNMDAWAVVITPGGYSLQNNGAVSTTHLPGLAGATFAFDSGVSVTSGSGIILFDEWGSPGNTSLTITLSDGSYTHSITVAAETGYQS